jgi:hypothetical protein
MSGCAALFWLQSHGARIFGGVATQADTLTALTHARGMHIHVLFIPK